MFCDWSANRSSWILSGCDIDYIPDKCAGIGGSSEFREVLRELDQKVNEVEDVIKLASYIKQLQSSLQEYKASQQNGQLYITMKQLKSKLKSDEIKEADRSLKKTNMQYIFEQNQDLEDMLSRQNALGKLALSSLPTCLISGCVLLSSDKLVAADYSNEKLKVVDIKNKVVIEETILSSKPWDIAVMPRDHIAVTLPEKKEILIMTTSGKPSIVHKFPVKTHCRGIAYHQGHLYIVCYRAKCVFITDTQGNVQNKILLDKKRLDKPSYLLLSKDVRHIFISVFLSHSVVSITLQGDISAEYKNKEFTFPRGMVMLDDGSLLVCCGSKNGIIYRISGDLKQCHTIIDDMSYPMSTCYNRDQHEVYVGCFCDEMIVLSAK
ncbi:uncharacterized protein LOC128546424 [Mercenaria mercenaria]|uniref:uncharacterized protein LOC128546424 n=1 Tax=Mercenaria mercenaria TaxID=6596 RepID=UPI00234EA322|nr:uncharacterized protein LOC128546424 [Mercenaria mercenaria]